MPRAFEPPAARQHDGYAPISVLAGPRGLAASGDGPGCRRPHRRTRRDALAARCDEQHDDALVRRRERPVARCPDHLGHDHPDPLGRGGGQRAGTRPPHRPFHPPTTAAPPAMGGYTVRPGDSLSAIAATARVPMSAIASMNGLDPNGDPPVGHRPQAADRLARAGGRLAARARDDERPAGRAVRLVGPRVAVGHRRRGDPQRRAGLAGLRDRLAGVRVQQRDGLQRQRARRDAGHAGHVELGAGEPRARASSTRARRSTTSARASCTWATCCRRRAAIRRSRRPATTRASSSVRAIGMLPETQRYVANVMALRARFGG